MAELPQVDLSRCSCSVTLGFCANGSPYSLDLAKSHGIIVAGGSEQARAESVELLLRSAKHEFGVSFAWCGEKAPEGVQTVPIEQAADSLKAFCDEQIERYDLMKKAGSNNLPHFNGFAQSRELEPLSFKFFVIEELQACLEKSGRKFIDQLCFAARYGRACGMLPIVCAADASPEKLPALLKAEIADRICLGVESRRDSLSLLGVLGGEAVREHELLFRHVAEKTDAVRLSAARG